MAGERPRPPVCPLDQHTLWLFIVFFWFAQALGHPFASPAVVPKYHAEEYKNRTTREIDCREEEYFLEMGRCCVKCPAGTYVVEHCRITHEQGKCGNCMSGEEFTEHNNGLEKCLSCKRCRSDQDIVSSCTSTKDTVCQCKPKTFCPPDQPCEQCYRCTDKCQPGMKLIQNCSATSNTVCEDPMEPQAPISTGSSVTLLAGEMGEATVPILPAENFPATHYPPTSWLPDMLSKEPFQKNTRDVFHDVLVTILSPIAVVLVIILVVVVMCSRRRHTKQLLANTGSLQDSTKTRASDSSLATPLLMSENPQNSNTLVQLDELCPPVPGSFASEQKPQAIESSEANNLNASPSGDFPEITRANQLYGGKQVVNEDISMIPASCPAPAEPPDKPVANLTGCNGTSSVQMYPDDTTYFYTIIQEVPTKEWRKFMRHMQLTENEIEAAIHDNPYNVNEQHYEMLCKWKFKFGKEANVKKLLQGLEEINLKGCAENIHNNIVAKGRCISSE